MSLWMPVELEENGQVSPDDGQTSWQSTLVSFGFGISGVIVDVHVDGYSFNARAFIKRDDFGFPPHLLEQLAIKLYWYCGRVMREMACDIGTCGCDIEGVLRRLFYHADAERMLRKFRLALTANPTPPKPASIP